MIMGQSSAAAAMRARDWLRRDTGRCLAWKVLELPDWPPWESWWCRAPGEERIVTGCRWQSSMHLAGLASQEAKTTSVEEKSGNGDEMESGGNAGEGHGDWSLWQRGEDGSQDDGDVLCSVQTSIGWPSVDNNAPPKTIHGRITARGRVQVAAQSRREGVGCVSAVI